MTPCACLICNKGHIENRRLIIIDTSSFECFEKYMIENLCIIFVSDFPSLSTSVFRPILSTKWSNIAIRLQRSNKLRICCKNLFHSVSKLRQVKPQPQKTVTLKTHGNITYALIFESVSVASPRLSQETDLKQYLLWCIIIY